MTTTTRQPSTTPGSARTDDPAWLEDLFRAHHRDVLAYAVRRVGPQAADDVLAEVFTTAWRHRVKVPEPPLPWLYRTAANHVLHARRSRPTGSTHHPTDRPGRPARGRE